MTTETELDRLFIQVLAETKGETFDRVWNGDYNGENCENCGRERVMLCSNCKRLCEKCNWCPEDKEYVLLD